jgi:hypothetical protein
MRTLREHTKDALSATEPTDKEAQAALQAILAPSHKKRLSRSWLFAPALATAALIVYLVAFPRSPAGVDRSMAKPNGGVHLYLRSNHEPEAFALSLDLDTKGEP